MRRPSAPFCLLAVLFLCLSSAAYVSAEQPASLSDTGTNKLEANKKLVLDFYDRVFNRKDFSTVDACLDKNYIQHNPQVPTGRDGFVKGVGEMLKQNPHWKTTFKRVIAEGDLVVVHNWAQPDSTNPKDRGLAIVDIFRVENGKIMEHWDVIQPVGEKSANDNTMF